MNQLLCIGNYSNCGMPILEFNDGIFKNKTFFSNFSNCSFVVKNNKFFYNVIEISKDNHLESGKIVSHSINEHSLDYINSTYSLGNLPCHLKLDSSRNILYASNYGSGSFSAFKILENGQIGNMVFFEEFEKNTSHIHFIELSKDKNNIFVIDLGTNKIHAYSIIDNPDYNLKLCATFCFPDGSEPRHLILENNNRIHVITEKSCEIYTLDFINNNFNFISKTTLITDSYKKENDDTGCAIKIDKNCNYIYASLRGKNLICVFKIQKDRLNLIQAISCYGSMPRDISFDLEEKYIICANQASNNLSCFLVSPSTGKLTFESSFEIEKPSCILPFNN